MDPRSPTGANIWGPPCQWAPSQYRCVSGGSPWAVHPARWLTTPLITGPALHTESLADPGLQTRRRRTLSLYERSHLRPIHGNSAIARPRDPPHEGTRTLPATCTGRQQTRIGIERRVWPPQAPSAHEGSAAPRVFAGRWPRTLSVGRNGSVELGQSHGAGAHEQEAGSSAGPELGIPPVWCVRCAGLGPSLTGTADMTQLSWSYRLNRCCTA